MANADHSESAKRRKTGYSCCVANCTGKHSDFISLHKFPLDSSVRKQWIRFVNVCRADFGPSFGTPTTNSRICERHFTPESYDPSYWLKQSFGIPCVGKQLKHGAVPTIQKHSFSTPLHRGQTVFTVSTTVTTTASCATSQCVVTSSGQRPKPSYVLPGVKKTRGAYAKRKHQRTLDNIFTKNDECMELPVLPSADSSEVQEETGTAEGHTQTEPLQVKLKVRKKPKMVQVYPASVMQQQHLVRHRGTQCERNQKNAVTQCNLALDSSHQPPTDGAGDSVGSEDQQSDTEMEMAADQQCEATFDAEYQPILFSGVAVFGSFEMTISNDTFFEHQTAYLHPCIDHAWRRFQQYDTDFMLQEGEPLILGGDGRADSAGHSAKYGTYTTVDLKVMKVVDVQLVQSNEVGGSPKMELQGLKQSVAYLEENGLTVGQLVTDRAPSVIKYVRENMPNTVHKFDVWHVVKGLKKKLFKLSREKDCELLAAWMKSILNHLYWVAVSTPDGDGELMMDKWRSLANHIHNVHHHQGQRFSKCQHPPLAEGDRRKKWLKPGTKLSAKLGELLESRQMLKDVPKLSTGPQTSAIEAYHSVLNHFAPKMIGFHHHGMVHRAKLAALHFNENHEREQARSQDGRDCYNLSFRKSKKGFTLQEVKVSCTYDYVCDLQEEVMGLASLASIVEMKEYLRAQDNQAPPPLCAEYEDARPEKLQAIADFQARFKWS